MTRVLATLAAVAAIAVGLPLVSQASHRDLRDPNDVRGPLDVRAMKVGEDRPPRWFVATYKGWKAGSVWDSGFVVIKFDTFGDSHFDYYALVRSDGYRMLGSLWRDYTRRSDRELSKLRVSRPSHRSVSVRVRFGKMRFREPVTYRWNATTSWVGNRCQNVCLDRIPQKGAVMEPKPTSTPLPSITLTTTTTRTTPSPSPSES